MISTSIFDTTTAAIKGARANQEDSLIANFPQAQHSGFAILADGMGGHLSGGVASATVLSSMFSCLKRAETMIEAGDQDIPALLRAGVAAANKDLSHHMAQVPETHGMGSTLLVTVI